MKNQYCGDVGDLSKFALLRGLQHTFPAERIGIVWYLTADDPVEKTAKDGRFVDYPGLEPCDPELHHKLQTIVRGRRDVSEFRRLGLTGGMVEYSKMLDSAQDAPRMRPESRERWFQEALRVTTNCSFVFLDPDNGIAPDRIRLTQVRCDKFALSSEVESLHSRGQSVICYQHANRSKDFDEQLADIASKFHRSFTLRWRPFQARGYLIWPSTGRDLRPWAQSLVDGPWRERFSRGPESLQ
jgi:hypothetical protein